MTTQLDRRQILQGLGAIGLSAALGGRQPALAQNGANKIRIGQIGTGHAHAAGKMATLRKFSNLYEVVGIVEPDATLRATHESDPAYKGLPWLTEEQLLNTPNLQAVAVETRVGELVPTGTRCIMAGKHIHLDKPAGESLTSFRNLLEEAKRRHLVVQMGYMFRYNSAFQFLFRAVRDGWLGQIFSIHGVINKAIDDESRKSLAGYEGGSMFELGCHLIDAVVTVLGKPQRVTAFPRRTRDDQLNDNMLAVLEFEKATATVRSALMEVEGTKRRQFVVCGDQGTIDIRPLEPPRLALTLDRPRPPYTKGTQEIILPQSQGRYDGDFEDFAKLVRGTKAPDYSYEHDLAVQEAVLLASGLSTDH